MALMNYSLPYGPHVSNTWSTIATGLQAPHANAVNGLLYDPAAHQEEAAAPYGPDYYRNNPYGPPRHMQSNFRNTNYLPPHPAAPNPAPHTHTPTQPRRGDYGSYTNSQSHVPTTRTYGESSYSSRGSVKTVTSTTTTTTTASGAGAGGQFGFSDYSRNSQPSSFNTRPVPRPTVSRGQTLSGRREQVRPPSKQGEPSKSQSEQEKQGGAGIPGRPGGYVHVQSGQGKNTHTVAVVDYDDDEEDGEEDDEYYDTADGAQPDGPNSRIPNVTPIQGPIFLGQNGTVPVVPLVQNPTLTNSSFVQIPIWWTALSVALGLNVRGDVIRGAPCIKRNHQLFCPQAGSQYPKDKIEAFIDDNKALMKRMYGDFSMSEDYGSVLAQSKKRKRNAKWDDPYEPDWAAEMYGPPGAGPDPIRDAGPSGDSYFSRLRNKRQSSSSRGNNSRRGNRADSTGRVDACESKVEIVTPYWASNSAGKIRAIVNTQHFEQAIHQEVCTNVQTSRCAGDCGCEQKYKWHRLLAYDPDNDCKGIFMDWFLFPSCCVCRCNPLTTN